MTDKNYSELHPQLPLGALTTGDFIREYAKQFKLSFCMITDDGVMLEKEEFDGFLENLTNDHIFFICKRDTTSAISFIWYCAQQPEKILMADRRVEITTDGESWGI